MSKELARPNFQIWKRFLDSARAFLFSANPPRITENSPLREVLRHYPQGVDVLRQQFHLIITPSETGMSLKELSRSYGLPPPQVLFMEIQLAEKNSRISQISPLEAKQLLQRDPSVVVVDVREPGEWCHHEGIAGAIRCEEQALESAVNDLPRAKAILLYCHFGVRSLNFAHWLADKKFSEVFVIRGGLDAWSVQVDSTIARYDGTYC